MAINPVISRSTSRSLAPSSGLSKAQRDSTLSKESAGRMPVSSLDLLLGGSVAAKGANVLRKALTKTESAFFKFIKSSKADWADLVESVPSVKYVKGAIEVAEKDLDRLLKYVDDTVMFEKGEGNPKLPPSFYKGDFVTKIVQANKNK